MSTDTVSYSLVPSTIRLISRTVSVRSTAPCFMQLHALKCRELRVCRTGQNRTCSNKLCTVRRTELFVRYRHLHVSVVDDHNRAINTLFHNKVTCSIYCIYIYSPHNFTLRYPTSLQCLLEHGIAKSGLTGSRIIVGLGLAKM